MARPRKVAEMDVIALPLAVGILIAIYIFNRRSAKVKAINNSRERALQAQLRSEKAAREAEDRRIASQIHTLGRGGQSRLTQIEQVDIGSSHPGIRAVFEQRDDNRPEKVGVLDIVFNPLYHMPLSVHCTNGDDTWEYIASPTSEWPGEHVAYELTHVILEVLHTIILRLDSDYAYRWATDYRDWVDETLPR